MIDTKSFEQVMERFGAVEFTEPFDLIVAIANGGLVPAGILAQRFDGVEVRLLRLSFRDSRHKAQYDEPRLLAPLDFDPTGRRILIVDDRVKTGSTIRLARKLLEKAASVRVFAVNGQADYSLYDEPCFRFPWT